MYFHYDPYRYKAFRERIVPEKVVASFFIPMREIMTLNKYINLERRNRFAAAAAKKRVQGTVMRRIADMGLKNIRGGPYHIHFCWAIPNKRSDMDNIAWAKKYVLDALVASETFAGDGMKHIESFSDDYEVTGVTKQGVWVEVIQPLTISEFFTYGSAEEDSGTPKRKREDRRSDTDTSGDDGGGLLIEYF